MVDVHCHLNLKAFKKDYDEVIQRAFDNGITKIINVGTQVSSSKDAVALAEKYDNLYAIIGVHPHHVDKIEPDWTEKLEIMASHPKVVGIGECGLDYYSYKSNGIVDPTLQRDIFIKHIALAHRTNLPLQIHNRHAGEDIIDILTAHKHLLRAKNPGMFHCFAGSMEVLQNALALGFYIGFDGNITYKGLAPGENTDLKDLAKHTPIDRILIETDSPFLAPEPHRGSRNEPKYAILTAAFLAEVKNTSVDELIANTTQNANSLFGLQEV